MKKPSIPENLWKSPVILRRLLQEAEFEADSCGLAEKPHYWCMVPQADKGYGSVTLRNYPENSIADADPHEAQVSFATDLMEQLQSAASFDGFWLVGFTHPPSSYGVLTDTENCWNRLIAIWFDQGGDPQFTLDSDLPFIDQVQAGVDYYTELGVESHKRWEEIYGHKVMKSDMMLKEGQMHHAALEGLKASGQ